ncbi:MAG: alpha/beta hydrolase family protein [Cyclobacteriaceae bacterium]
MQISEMVEIGGIRQYIEIRGLGEQSPLLLFFHGGPGNSVTKRASAFTSELQKHFLVVLWDQRNSGQTRELNAPSHQLNLALMESDALELIQYLLKRFRQPKLFLFGHSWGGFLALRIAASHPELVKACMAVSPMIYQEQSERESLAWMLDKARSSNNAKAITELEQVNVPFENADHLYWHRYWLARFSGNRPPDREFVKRWSVEWLALLNEASRVNLMAGLADWQVPLFLFIGGRDYQTHYNLAREFFTHVKARKKDLFWFPNSGHNLLFSDSRKVQEQVISILNDQEIQ